ncbi:hypothetical protein CEXT_241891 [Caerostris extrusa]|uniref:Uncharacterized protein n=1 Tax=Caerostris extrusa TaxID=172846 RepID=A0AAV4SUN5_CAEEX|nr:hypothetical protein CEXT_241891 [Caerostris extrusa]
MVQKRPDKITKQRKKAPRDDSISIAFSLGNRASKRHWITHCEISIASRSLDHPFLFLSVMKTWASRSCFSQTYTQPNFKKKQNAER